MLKSFTLTSTFAAGLVVFGVLVPQQTSAGNRGGFHGGGGAPHVAAVRPAFHPAVHPAFHQAFHPAVRFAPRHTMIGGFHPRSTHFAGLVRPLHGGRERTRFGHFEHGRGRYARLSHDRFIPAFYQPDYAEPETAVPETAMPTDVTPVQVVGPVVGPIATGGAPTTEKALSNAPVTAEACAAGGAGSSVLVTFAPNATAVAISNFMKAYNVTIVDGPAMDGRYRVRLANRLLPQNEVMQAVQSMQSQSAIVSAVSVL